MKKSITIEILTKDKILQHINDIKHISKDAFGDKSWKTSQFLYDLPNKWQLSSIIKYENKIIGFRIVSSYYFQSKKTAHGHYTAILSEFKGKGLFKYMHNFTIKLCNNENIYQMTAETTEGGTHPNTHKVFENIGYVQIHEKELIIDYLIAKNKKHLLKYYLDNKIKVYINKNIIL